MANHSLGIDHLPRSPVDDLFDEHPLSYSFLPPTIASPSPSCSTASPLCSQLSALDLRRPSGLSSRSSLGTLCPEAYFPLNTEGYSRQRTLRHEVSLPQFSSKIAPLNPKSYSPPRTLKHELSLPQFSSEIVPLSPKSYSPPRTLKHEVSLPQFSSEIAPLNPKSYSPQRALKHDPSPQFSSEIAPLNPKSYSPQRALKHDPSPQFGAISTESRDAPRRPFDQADRFTRSDAQLDVSDDPPTRDTLRQAWNVPVYDAAGNHRSFKSLHPPGERHLFVFIRHFHCGACRAYVSALARALRSKRGTSTSVTVVGCGSPALIRQYQAATGCPFPIFTDPSRRLYRALGMGLTLDVLGRGRPGYMGDVGAGRWLVEQVKVTLRARGRRMFMGGNMLQVGGEFLFERGEVVWCHRMRDMRGHADVEVVRRVVGV